MALARGRRKRRRTGDPDAKPQKCPCRQAFPDEVDDVDEAMGFAPRPRDPSRDIASQCTAGQWTNCAAMAWLSVTFAQVPIIGPTRV